MKLSKRVRRYAQANYGEVMHTTLNPNGPGVVRIHFIPPVADEEDLGAGVAIINGQDILPVNTSWCVLLSEFIKAVNAYEGKEVTQEDADHIADETCKQVRKVYPLVPKKMLKDDIYRLLNTFKQVAYGEEVDESIGYMTLGEYAPYMRAPHRMDLMVSAMTKAGKWHCNQQCVHCYAAGQANAEEEELTTEQWKTIIDKCRAAGIPQVTFTGGEPTMREDLVELIEHAKWFVTRLNTNGVKLTKEFCDSLREASLDSMQITFYSHDEEVHNKLVGAPKYKDTVAGIENAIAAGLNISINTPLCTLNKDYVKTLEFLHDKGVMYVTCSGLITTGNALEEASEKLQLTKEEIQDVLRSAVNFCFSHQMEISFTSPGWVDNDFCDSIGITTPTCGACLSNMAVTPGGNVVPCQSWLSDDVLGSMLTDDWSDIWNNQKTVERRDYSAAVTGKCPLRKSQGGEA